MEEITMSEKIAAMIEEIKGLSVLELSELQNGKTLDLFDHGSDFFTHCNFLQ